MIKKWKVVAQVNLMAEKQETVFVKANTERKARAYATEKLKNNGFFNIMIIRCVEDDHR